MRTRGQPWGTKEDSSKIPGDFGRQRRSSSSHPCTAAVFRESFSESVNCLNCIATPSARGFGAPRRDNTCLVAGHVGAGHLSSVHHYCDHTGLWSLQRQKKSAALPRGEVRT